MPNYRLLISSNEDKSFRAIVVANGNDKTSKLMEALLQIGSYPEGLLCSFLICDENGIPILELLPDESFVDVDSGYQKDMKDVSINELLSFDQEHYCFFIFDFLNERGLSIMVLDDKAPAEGTTSLIDITGTAPQLEDPENPDFLDSTWDNIDDDFLEGDDFEEEFFDEENFSTDDNDDYFN